MKNILLFAFIAFSLTSSSYALECFTSAEDIANYKQKNIIRQAANKLNQIIFDNWQYAEKVIRNKIQQSRLWETNKTYLYNLVTNRPWYIKNIEVSWEKIYVDIDRASYANISDCYADFYGITDNKSTKTRRYTVRKGAIIWGYESSNWSSYGAISMDDTEDFDDQGNYIAWKQCTMWTFLANAYKLCNGSFSEYADFHYGLCDSTGDLKPLHRWGYECWSQKTLPLTYVWFDIDQYTITSIVSVYRE